MRILYGIQGTGNGHKSRAEAIVPELRKYAEVELLISGLPMDKVFKSQLEIDKRVLGFGFIFGKDGGIDWRRTKQAFSFRNLIKEIQQLDLKSYDLVISDYEPVSAWAARLQGKPSLSLSHQSALLEPNVPGKQKLNFWKRLMLRFYSPSNASKSFHFDNYSSNIEFPIIRPGIRNLRPFDDGHYLIYLPAYGVDSILEMTSSFPDQDWIVFDKRVPERYRINNTLILPADQNRFLHYLESTAGVICGAGFELPAEALFLKKKLMVVPMKGQFEQQMNAIALASMGVANIPYLDEAAISLIREWLNNGHVPEVNYPDNVSKIVNEIIETYNPNYCTKENLLLA